MKNLLIFSLLVWGNYFILQTKIFEKIREFLLHNCLTLYHGWTCPACTGFWISIFWSLTFIFVKIRILFISYYNVDLFLCLIVLANGLIGSAMCTLIEVMFRFVNDRLKESI